MTVIAGQVVAPPGVQRGWIELAGERIVQVQYGAPPSAAHGDPSWTIVPGFVDVHVHGGGGHSMTSGDVDAVLAAAAFHREHGTTTTLVSLVTAPVDELLAVTAGLAEMLEDGAPEVAGIAGIHLEGPFLSPARCGAQNPAHMIDPDPDLVDELIAAGRGLLRVVTIAPERDGALDAVRRFTAAGVVVALGHTDAAFDQAQAAIDAGATLATHLGNAMPALHHREPGPIGACLAAAGVACELIVDGHHLHPAFVRTVTAAKGHDGVVLITDAIAAAGAGDGRYTLGGLDVEVRNGVARLVEGGSLAGSTLTMDRAVRQAVACGLPLTVASAAATHNPARLLGLAADRGSIEPGKRADLVVLDAELEARAVLVAGEVVAGALDRP